MSRGQACPGRRPTCCVHGGGCALPTGALPPRRLGSHRGIPPLAGDAVRHLLSLAVLVPTLVLAADIPPSRDPQTYLVLGMQRTTVNSLRSEEHTSELQSRPHLVCRLLLEKKKKDGIT